MNEITLQIGGKMGNNGEYFLEMRHIKKHFGALVAVGDGCIRAKRGEVNALVGGNGAGKSTLIKILSGSQHDDGGDIIIDGKKVSIRTPMDAFNMGVKTIYQDLSLFENMNVTENFFIGREILYGGIAKPFKILNRKAMNDYALKEVKRMGFNIPLLSAKVRTMSGGQRQAISCARALLGGSPSILIMDEPTAALGVKEAAEVIDMMKKYRDDGTAIILISHNMRTVFDVANEITVMRLGQTIADVKRDEVTEEEIVGLMTGAIDRITDGRDMLSWVNE